MANFTKNWRVPNWQGVWNAAATDIGPNLCLVNAGTTAIGGLPSLAVPGTGTTPTTFEGITRDTIKSGRAGDVASMEGDIVVALADVSAGNILKGSRLTIGTVITKEGYVLLSTADLVVKVGEALEGATVDGTPILVRLDPKPAET